MRRGLIILCLFSLFTSSFANRVIAKDSTPGGIYIVGPDVSPDSTDLTFLYYSPDAGSTLVIRDTLNWCEVKGIAADRQEGVVYVTRHALIDEGVWVSSDGGITWENRGDYLSLVPYSGNVPGEVLFGVAEFSTDFGYSVHIGNCVILGPTGDYSVLSYGGGAVSGESYYVSVEGFLLWSWCYGDTFAVIDSVGPWYITAGNEPGEVWLLRSDTLFYSADHGSTFAEMGIIPIEFTDFIRGSHSGSLFICHIEVNESCMTGVRGGQIEICYTEDFGESYVCITHNGEGRTIEEISSVSEEMFVPERSVIHAYPNPFNSELKIELDFPSRVLISDVRGRRVYDTEEAVKEFVWRPKDIPSGVYFIKPIDIGGVEKVIYIK